jgi:hypothetical protein
VVPFVLLATDTVSDASPQTCAVQPILPHSAPTIWLSKTVDHVPLFGIPDNVLPVMSL